MTDHHAKDQAQAQYESIKALVERLREASDLDHGNTYDLVRDEIMSDPLFVLVRDGWRTPGQASEDSPEEYEILLCTGGPAVRIYGKLGRYSEPETATIEYQDWFKPWVAYEDAAEDILLDYARCFYFGE